MILPETLSDRYNDYPHFKSKETWAQDASVLYQGRELVPGGYTFTLDLCS